MSTPPPGGPAPLGTRTTTRLLDDLRDPANAAAWEGFDARYRPILVAIARRRGFADHDAAEIAQQTLAEFARSYAAGRYERGRGRLSSWLIGIAGHVAARLGRTNGSRGAHAENHAAEGWERDASLAEAWRHERERAIIGQALALIREEGRMRDETLRAFELFAIRGVPAAEVARQCGMSVDAVYVVKNRLTGRLRELVRELTIAYDEDE